MKYINSLHDLYSGYKKQVELKNKSIADYIYFLYKKRGGKKPELEIETEKIEE